MLYHFVYVQSTYVFISSSRALHVAICSNNSSSFTRLLSSLRLPDEVTKTLIWTLVWWIKTLIPERINTSRIMHRIHLNTLRPFRIR